MFAVPAAQSRIKRPFNRTTLWGLRLLALVALGSSLFLTWQSIQTGPIPGCGTSTFDCDHVVTSAWSRWLGIPVSYLGCATYAVILLGLFALKPKATFDKQEFRQQLRVWSILVPVVVMAALGGLWFSYLQFFKIGKLCPYCLVTHACGLMITITLAVGVLRFIKTVPDEGPPERPLKNGLRLSALVAAGSCAACSLVLGQIWYPHETFVVERINDHINELPNSDASTMNAGLTDGTNTFATPIADSSKFRADDNLDGTFFAAPGTEGATPEVGAFENGAFENGASDSTNSQDDDFASDLDDIGPAAVGQTVEAVGRSKYRFYPRVGTMNVYAHPVLGDPDAKQLIVEVVDYTCHHCREMYHHIEAAREHFGDDLGVVVRPVALEQQCNPYLTRPLPAHENACKYVRLALAVWTVNPEKFPEFHHWLMGPKKAPDVATAADFAKELVGSTELAIGVKDTKALGMLGKNHYLWNTIGGSLPQIFAGQALIRGMPRDDEHFIETLKTQFRTAR